MLSTICSQNEVRGKYEPFYSGEKGKRLAQCKAVDELIENGIGSSPRNAWATTYMIGNSLKPGESFESAFKQHNRLYEAHLSYIANEAPFPQGPEESALGEANRSYRLLDQFISDTNLRETLIAEFINILHDTKGAKKTREVFLLCHPKEDKTEKKSCFQKIFPKIKNCAVTTGKVAAGEICGMAIGTFIIPAGIAYYSAKKTITDIKKMIKDKDFKLWSTCLQDIGMATIGTAISCVLGPVLGAVAGLADADEEGLGFAIKNRIGDFKFCEEVVEDVVNNKDSHVLW